MTSTTTAVGSATSTTPTCSPYVPPGKHGYVPYYACNNEWNYNVNIGAAIVFSIIFGGLTLAHVVQAIVHRRSFPWVIAMGAAWETGSFISKALGAYVSELVNLLSDCS